MERKEWLENLSVGDDVIVCDSYGRMRDDKVTRLTKTLIFVGGDKFNKSHGVTPGESFRWSSLNEPTPERIQRMRLIEMRARIRAIDWAEISEETIKQVLKVIDEAAKDDTEPSNS